MVGFAFGLRAVPQPQADAVGFGLRITFSHVCSSVGGPVGVAHSFHPSLLLGGGLVRFCGGLCCRSLALS